jgi:hypothetical protein
MGRMAICPYEFFASKPGYELLSREYPVRQAKTQHDDHAIAFEYL